MWQSIWEGGVCCIALELRRIVWGCSSAMPTSSGGSGGQMGGVQLGYEQSSGGQGDMFQPLHRDGSDQRSGDEQHCSPDLSTGSPLHVRIQSPPPAMPGMKESISSATLFSIPTVMHRCHL